jgi:hypothetical protein
MANLKLKDLYNELSKKPNSPLAYIANVIYTNYGRNRKPMLQGLYNIVNGGPRHYWAKCEVTFAPFSSDVVLATNLEANGRKIREIDVANLAFYA